MSVDVGVLKGVSENKHQHVTVRCATMLCMSIIRDISTACAFSAFIRNVHNLENSTIFTEKAGYLD